jgi:hypothetical protein
VTFVHSRYRCGNYTRAETIRGNTVYILNFFILLNLNTTVLNRSIEVTESFSVCNKCLYSTKFKNQITITTNVRATLWRHEPERGYNIDITQPKVISIKNWNENRVMILLNIKNWNEYRVVQLKEN